MIKVLLAQILFKPAIIEKDLDLLSEPGIYNFKLGKSFNSLIRENIINENEMDVNYREKYLEYFKDRLVKIIEWANKRKADLLVFPEYSIPYQCLPQLYDLSKLYNITIVAGSHTVIQACEPYYDSVGFTEDVIKAHMGESIAPVFMPDGNTQFQSKLKKSIFELSMNTPEERIIKTFRSLSRNGMQYSFSVLLCVDTLDINNIGKVIDLASRHEDEGYMLVAPSLSPNTEVFYNIAKNLALVGKTLLFCNSAQYGNSGVYLDQNVILRYMSQESAKCIADSEKEQMIEIEFSPNENFVKKGQIDNRIIGRYDIFPIYYNDETNWITGYQESLEQVWNYMKDNDTYSAEEVLDLFLTNNQYKINVGLSKQINNFIARLGNFTGNFEEFMQMLEALILTTYNIRFFLGNEIEHAMQICMHAGIKAYENIKPLMIMSEVYKSGKELPLQASFPKEINGVELTADDINSFRDRGSSITMLQNYVNDNEVKIIMISGAFGIGKSVFVDVAFKKHYPDWNIIKIVLPSKTRFSMVLEQIGSAIGYSISADLLSRVGKNQLRPYMKKIVEAIFSQNKRAIVVDDMSSVLIDNNGRDNSLIQLFMKSVNDCQYKKGKMFFVGSTYFSKNFFIDCSRLIVIKSMERKYIDRIITYEMRARGMAKLEKDPEIPEKIYDIVKGHPLSAKLAVTVLEKNNNESFQDINENLVQSEIVHELIKKITVHLEVNETMQLLSVFRWVIHIPTLLKILPEEMAICVKEELKDILRLNFVSYDGENLEFLESIRIYYNNILREDEDKKEKFYEYALLYYQMLYQSKKAENKFNPMIYSELTYHYLEKGKLSELKELLDGNKESLKLHARVIYQQYHEYGSALQIYDMINRTFENDPEVLAYIGRCNARLNNWRGANISFEKAIDVAKWRKEDTWYLYRDWGHILVRYDYTDEAQEKFKYARNALREETEMEDDPAILAAEGYICEQKGDIEEAEEKYKEALSYNYAHKYTIYYYSKLLKRIGKQKEAKELENRIENFGETQIFDNMVEYEFLSKSDEMIADEE